VSSVRFAPSLNHPFSEIFLRLKPTGKIKLEQMYANQEKRYQEQISDVNMY